MDPTGATRRVFEQCTKCPHQSRHEPSPLYAKHSYTLLYSSLFTSQLSQSHSTRHPFHSQSHHLLYLTIYLSYISQRYSLSVKNVILSIFCVIRFFIHKINLIEKLSTIIRLKYSTVFHVVLLQQLL